MNNSKLFYWVLIALAVLLITVQAVVSLSKTPMVDDYAAINDARLVQQTSWGSMLSAKLQTEPPRVGALLLKTTPYLLLGLEATSQWTWVMIVLFFVILVILVMQWVIQRLMLTIDWVTQVGIATLLIALASITPLAYYEIWLWLPGFVVHAVPLLPILGIVYVLERLGSTVQNRVLLLSSLLVLVLSIALISELALLLVCVISTCWLIYLGIKQLVTKTTSAQLSHLGILVASSAMLLVYYKYSVGASVRLGNEQLVLGNDSINLTAVLQRIIQDHYNALSNIGIVSSVLVGVVIGKYLRLHTQLSNTMRTKLGGWAASVLISGTIALITTSILTQLIINYYAPLRIYTVSQYVLVVGGVLLGLYYSSSNFATIKHTLAARYSLSVMYILVVVYSIAISSTSTGFSYGLIGRITECKRWYDQVLLPQVATKQDVVLRDNCTIPGMISLGSNPQYWYNQEVSKYYGIKSIRVDTEALR